MEMYLGDKDNIALLEKPKSMPLLVSVYRLLSSEPARTTRYCREVTEKIREVEMKMSPHALRPFSSTSWVTWMVGSVNLSS